MKTYPLGRKRERDLASGLDVWTLTDVPDMQFFWTYFTNNPFPSLRQVVCFGEPAHAPWSGPVPRILYVIDFDAGEMRQVTPPIETRDRWMAVCGIAAARQGNRALWATEDKVFRVDLAHGGVEEIYRRPSGWGFGQSNCDASGRVFSVGETMDEFMNSSPKPDGFTLDSRAKAWPKPVGRVVLVDVDKGESKVVCETSGVPSHANVHPRDENLVMFCHEGHWTYVQQRVWLADAQTGQARPICVPPKGYAVGHETWTDDGRVLFHGANLQLKPEDRGGKPPPPLECLIGTGHADGTLDRIYIDRNIRWGLPHVIMSPDGQWITSAGQWARDFVWIARWGEERLHPRLIAAHHGEGSGCVCPRFSPDGKSVLFAGQRTDLSQLYCVDLAE